MNEFFRCLLGSNPFASSHVRSTADAAVHVQTLHQRQFQQLITCAQRTLENRGDGGVVMWGEAGTGKSHLLVEFSRWTDQQRCLDTHFFRSLPMDPAAVELHIIKSVLRQMTRDHRGGPRNTALGRLMRKVVEIACADVLVHDQPFREAEARMALRRFVERRWHETDVTTELLATCDVLFRFFAARDNDAARSALRWLAGDSSGQGSPPASPGTTLIALTRLSSMGGRAMVLSFDQLDDLSPQQVQTLFRFIDPLIDHTRNLLLVLSGRQQALLEWVEQGIIPPSTWGRLTRNQTPVNLPCIGSAEAQQMLEARLRRFVEPFLTVAEIRERVEQDALFPLGSDWFERHLNGRSEFPPRDVLLWAAERWQQQQVDLHELGGPSWFDRTGRSGLSAARAVTVVAAQEPANRQRALVVRPATVVQSPGHLAPRRIRLSTGSAGTAAPRSNRVAS
jgi:hypothetical protein